ncbi:MAG TPA: C40 family peptidase [Chitinophagaceae bacterium]
MRISIVAIICFQLLACAASRRTMDVSIQRVIDSVQARVAPDKRTLLFEIIADHGILKGETSSAAAKDALLQRLNAAGIRYIDSISVLPASTAGGRRHGVVTISVANLRTQPSHKAELASQATMGTPLHLLKRQRGWYLVQTPDRYIAWIDAGAVEAMEAARATDWANKPKLIFTGMHGLVFGDTINHEVLTDLAFGNLVEYFALTPRFVQLRLPDGRTGFATNSDFMPYTEWRQSRSPLAANLVSSAKQLMGLPYLWGGTSVRGVDCSGFTRTVFLMNGLLLPRDASQQVLLGTEIDTAGGWSALQPGDLLFFGSRAQPGKPEQVVHVGLWVGNQSFIHASGKVQLASLDPSASDYDAVEHRRFLRVKRINASDALLDLRKTDIFFEW